MEWLGAIPKWLFAAAFAVLVGLLVFLAATGVELRYKDGIRFVPPSNPDPARFQIPEPVSQKIGEWVQLSSDGFLQVRVGGPGGATADVWCGLTPNAGDNRILGINGWTSDILVVRAGSWCRVDIKKANQNGGGVSAWFYALAAK